MRAIASAASAANLGDGVQEHDGTWACPPEPHEPSRRLPWLECHTRSLVLCRLTREKGKGDQGRSSSGVIQVVMISHARNR
jgi:hypothetical protein